MDEDDDMHMGEEMVLYIVDGNDEHPESMIITRCDADEDKTLTVYSEKLTNCDFKFEKKSNNDKYKNGEDYSDGAVLLPWILRRFYASENVQIAVTGKGLRAAKVYICVYIYP